MILSYHDLKFNVDKFNAISNSYGNESKGQVQKIYSTAHLICLVMRFPGRTRYVYIGRGSGHEGIWEGEKIPHSFLRVRDKFLEYFRKHLGLSRCYDFILDENDRILTIPYFKPRVTQQDRKSYLSLFWRGRQLFFMNVYYNGEIREVFLSWHYLDTSERKLHQQSPPSFIKKAFQEVGRRNRPFPERVVSSEKLNIFLDNYFNLQRKNMENKIIGNREKKFMERKETKIRSDLTRIAKWPELKSFLEMENNEIHESELDIAGNKFRFGSLLTFHQRKGIIFDKIKRLRAAEILLKKRLEDTIQARKLLEKIPNSARKNISKNNPKKFPKVISPVWNQEKNKHKKIPSKNNLSEIKEYKLDGNIKFGVGRNARGNDYLRNTWANRNDLWFHIEGQKSGHLILKIADKSKLDMGLLELIGSVLRDGAGLSLQQIPIIYTLVKNIRGLKGQPGAVTYKKVKHLVVNYNGNWKEIISPV